jgi:flagellar motor switch protein FliN/FliY
MPLTLQQLMKLEVPIVVRLAQRQMAVKDVIGLAPGSIIELQRSAESELDLLANDRLIGNGNAVKVGENFGIRITFVGDQFERAAAMATSAGAKSAEDADAEALAEQLLAGQF